MKAVEDAGAFRAPTNAARSFNPQHGDAQQLRAVDSMTVRSTEGRETLLKLALPAPQGSGNAAAQAGSCEAAGRLPGASGPSTSLFAAFRPPRSKDLDWTLFWGKKLFDHTQAELPDRALLRKKLFEQAPLEVSLRGAFRCAFFFNSFSAQCKFCWLVQC